MEVTLTVEPTNAACPACRSAMTRLVTLRGLVAGCTACGGVWIDRCTVQQIGAQGIDAALGQSECACIPLVQSNGLLNGWRYPVLGICRK